MKKLFITLMLACAFAFAFYLPLNAQNNTLDVTSGSKPSSKHSIYNLQPIIKVNNKFTTIQYHAGNHSKSPYLVVFDNSMNYEYSVKLKNFSFYNFHHKKAVTIDTFYSGANGTVNIIYSNSINNFKVLGCATLDIATGNIIENNEFFKESVDGFLATKYNTLGAKTALTIIIYQSENSIILRHISSSDNFKNFKSFSFNPSLIEDFDGEILSLDPINHYFILPESSTNEIQFIKLTGKITAPHFVVGKLSENTTEKITKIPIEQPLYYPQWSYSDLKKSLTVFGFSSSTKNGEINEAITLTIDLETFSIIDKSTFNLAVNSNIIARTSAANSKYDKDLINNLQGSNYIHYCEGVTLSDDGFVMIYYEQNTSSTLRQIGDLHVFSFKKGSSTVNHEVISKENLYFGIIKFYPPRLVTNGYSAYVLYRSFNQREPSLIVANSNNGLTLYNINEASTSNAEHFNHIMLTKGTLLPSNELIFPSIWRGGMDYYLASIKLP